MAYDLSKMDEGDVIDGIRRCHRTIERQPGFRNGALIALVLGFGVGLFGAAALFTGAAGGFMLGVAGATGFGGMIATALTGRFVMQHAHRNLAALEKALPQKTEERKRADAEAAWQEFENEQRLKRQAEEKFNAAVDAGLPLEKPVRVGKSLQLKLRNRQRGFIRV
jgi:hypothetical protein